MPEGHRPVAPAANLAPRTLRPEERLKKRAEYLRVKREGRRLPCGAFLVNIAVNGLAHHRLGLVVEKRFWKAVQRNRIKRRVREWFRLHKHTVPLPGLDIVVIARPGAEHFSTPHLADLFQECFRKGGLRMA